MCFLSNLFSVAKREVRQSMNQGWLVTMFIVMPVFWCILLIGIFGNGYLRELPVGIVDLDHTPSSYEFAHNLDALPSVRLVSLDSPQQAQSALQRAEIYAYLTIPNQWSARLSQPDSLAIEGYFPKSLYAIATSLELDIKTAIGQFSLAGAQKLATLTGANTRQAERSLHLLSVQPVTLGNLSFNFQAYLLPVLIPGLLHLGLALAIVTRLSAEWQNQSVKGWLNSAGSSPTTALIGKLLPWWLYYSLLGCLFIAYFAGYAQWFAQGSILYWTFGLSFLLAVISLLPIFVMSLTIKAGWIIATSICVGYIAPIFPFTGFSFPFDAMQSWVVTLSQLFPLTHYVQFQAEQWILATPFLTSLLTLGKLAIFGVVFALIGIPLMSRQMKKAIEEETML